MSNDATLARPYAKAVFEYAMEQQQLPQWGIFLQYMAAAVRDEQVAALIGDPRLSVEQKQQLLLSLCKQDVLQQQENFMAALGHYQRLMIIPEIVAQFAELEEAYKKQVEVKITAAFPLSEPQQQKLTKALSIRLQRDVALKQETDNDLIGGAVIQAGDMVIDGSIRGQLDKLEKILID